MLQNAVKDTIRFYRTISPDFVWWLITYLALFFASLYDVLGVGKRLPTEYSQFLQVIYIPIVLLVSIPFIFAWNLIANVVKGNKEALISADIGIEKDSYYVNNKKRVGFWLYNNNDEDLIDCYAELKRFAFLNRDGIESKPSEPNRDNSIFSWKNNQNEKTKIDYRGGKAFLNISEEDDLSIPLLLTNGVMPLSMQYSSSNSVYIEELKFEIEIKGRLGVNKIKPKRVYGLIHYQVTVQPPVIDKNTGNVLQEMFNSQIKIKKIHSWKTKWQR